MWRVVEDVSVFLYRSSFYNDGDSRKTPSIRTVTVFNSCSFAIHILLPFELHEQDPHITPPP